MRRILPLLLLVSTAFVPATAHATARCVLPVFGPGRDYHPRYNPADFTPNVTNRWFPLPPGRTFVYRGVKDGKQFLDLFHPSSRTRVINGVTTRVVEDRGYLNNRLREKTEDYYAQDACGNVWYFGEDTVELTWDGHVDNHDGTWHAGVNGAEPGVYMPAHPRVGQQFRQEYLRGEAEDVFRVVSLEASVSVPYGEFSGALKTQEWTRLDPGVLDVKVYAGPGEVVEKAKTGPREVLQLVEVLR